MVISFSKHYKRQIITSITNQRNHDNRCFDVWLWGSCEETLHSRDMVRGSTETTYKLSGVGGDFSNIEHFLLLLKNQNVLQRCDNTLVVQYISKQGGTKSPQLCYRTWGLWKLAIQNNISEQLIF